MKNIADRSVERQVVIRMKAYAFLVDPCEGAEMIVYAENANKAKAKGAHFTDMEYTDIRIRRVPWADQYGDYDNIPPRAFIENGWWMYCCKCTGRVDSDSLGGYTTDGEPYCKYCKGVAHNEH